jgi:hypothetical protein
MKVSDLLLEQVAAHVRSFHECVHERLPDIRFCIETNRHAAAISLASQCITLTLAREPELRRRIADARHFLKEQL